MASSTMKECSCAGPVHVNGMRAGMIPGVTRQHCTQKLFNLKCFILHWCWEVEWVLLDPPPPSLYLSPAQCFIQHVAENSRNQPLAFGKLLLFREAVIKHLKVLIVYVLLDYYQQNNYILLHTEESFMCYISQKVSVRDQNYFRFFFFHFLKI